ncbi:MAG: helix-turn-helix domain-containing protein [Solirubrobacterales bacterium]
MARENDPTQALLDALRHPLRRALLHRCVVAEEPTSPKYLANSTRKPLSSVSYHVRELAKLGALEIVEEEQRRGAVVHFYVVTPLVTESVWALAAMGLRPPLADGEPYLLTPEEIAEVKAHVAERREDKEFMDRLARLKQEDRPVLNRLRESEEEESKKKQKNKGK